MPVSDVRPCSDRPTGVSQGLADPPWLWACFTCMRMRAVNPKLHSAIHHTASLRPRLSATYSKSLRDRQARADKPKRTMMRLDEESLGAGKVAQMASGFVGNAASSSSGGAKGKGRFGGFVRSLCPSRGRQQAIAGLLTSFLCYVHPTQEAKPKNLDKAHRLPRNELLDLLFPLFQEHTYWRLKTLKQRTQQPEAYLKEVLGEIGVLVKRGPYVGCWTLMEIYKTPAQQQQQQQQQQAAGSSGGVKTESGAVKSELGGADDGEDDDDDDDASDEDMEEV
jgi:transcription initiation factor TFIIF subunit beta